MAQEIVDIDSKCQEICIVFMDVDGVLNPTEWEQSVIENDDTYKHGRFELSIPHLKRIRTLFETMGEECKLVLSTSWRLESMTKKALLSQLNDREYIGKWSDTFPDNWCINNHFINNKNNDKNKYTFNYKQLDLTQTRNLQPLYPRICEIYDFVKRIRNISKDGECDFKVLNWICIDDNDLYCDSDIKQLSKNDINYYQIEDKDTFYKHHFIQTNAKIGITDQDIVKAIQLLKEKQDNNDDQFKC